MTFSCTNKVLSKIKTVREVTDDRAEISLNNWYVNWITLYRRRFALVTNSKTVFSVLMYCGTKNEIINFENLFAETIKEQINRLNGIKSNWNEKISLNIENSKFVKTNSQSVLANMREFKFLTEYYILDINNKEYELEFLMDKMNGMPIGNMQYQTPIEILRKTLNII
jgi:hypothetical protein